MRDAAVLFRLALEQAPAGSVLHAVGDEGVPGRELAEALARQLDLPAASVPADELGFLGGLLSIDQPASSALTQQRFDGKPTGPGLLEDIAQGHYPG